MYLNWICCWECKEGFVRTKEISKRLYCCSLNATDVGGQMVALVVKCSSDGLSWIDGTSQLFFMPLQEEYQWPVHGPGQRRHRVVGIYRRSGGQLPARPATSHQHEEDIHHRRGRRQEEEPVHPGQTSSGELGSWAQSSSRSNEPEIVPVFLFFLILTIV